MKVILISAIWCGSCIVMKNKWNDIEKEYNLDITHYDYDFDEDKIKQYDIGNILPVSIFIDRFGNEAYRLIGEKNSEDIKKIIEKLK